MPCSPGMRNCRIDCSHRRFVRDYRVDSSAQMDRAEAATGMNDTELASYFGTDGEGDAVEEKLTFKHHLQTWAGAYPYERHEDLRRSNRDAPQSEGTGEVGQAADR